MNYIHALNKFLSDDPYIFGLVGKDIAFLKHPKKGMGKIAIVFSEGEMQNDQDHFVGTGGYEIFEILIDITCVYEEVATARKLREYIVKKLNGCQNMGNLRYGMVAWDKHFGMQYNDEYERVLLGSVYTIRQDKDCVDQ